MKYSHQMINHRLLFLDLFALDLKNQRVLIHGLLRYQMVRWTHIRILPSVELKLNIGNDRCLSVSAEQRRVVKPWKCLLDFYEIVSR
jgi:hypothetical protein